MASWNYLDSPEAAKDLQNFLICLEMLFAAILLLFAFPYEEYKRDNVDATLGAGNVRHAISIRDVVNDTVHQFAPQYHDYVLYSDETTGKPVKYSLRPLSQMDEWSRKTVRTRTSVKMGEETTRYHDGANLLANSESVRESKDIEMTPIDEDDSKFN